MKQRLNPLNDFLFQKMLGEKGCEPQLKALLNALLASTGRKPLSEIQIIENTTLSPDIVGAKKSILDVRAQTQDNRKINIEVQLANEYNLAERLLFYWSLLFSRGIKSGQDYRELPQVIMIIILGFSPFKLERYHTSFHVREDLEPEFVLTDLLEMHFVDMPRFRKLAGKDIFENSEHRWLSYLDSMTPKEDAEELIKMDEGIARAQAIMDQITRDEKLMHAYERYAISLSDETSRLNGAREEGEARGIAKGIEVGRQEGEERIREAARNLRAMGLSAEQIAAATGLSPGEIARL